MKKILVVYCSHTGYTRKNAEMIADELKCEAVAVENLQPTELLEAQLVIYGGWLFASSCQGWKKFKKNPLLEGKQLALFITGACEGNAEQIVDFKKINLSPEEQQTIPLFYIRGGFNYQKLGFVNRTLMNAMKMRLLALKKKGTLPEDGHLLLEAYDQAVDFTDRNNVLPLCAWAQEVAASS